jgi:N-acetylglutamate synthase-like GNAT family acetyltransferase
MPLSMRRADRGDIEALRALMEALSGHPISPEEMGNRLEFVAESQVDSLFVCEEDGRIAGLLGFRIRENLEEMSRYGEISAIVVDPDDRHRGVGLFMMDYAERLAKEKGCKGSWLVSGFGREQKAHKFYKRLGYQINGYRFVKPFVQK